jgi:hypothetical protein
MPIPDIYIQIAHIDYLFYVLCYFCNNIFSIKIGYGEMVYVS